MSYKIEIDGAGRECIRGEHDGRPVFLILQHVMCDVGLGHYWLSNDRRDTLARLAPWQVKMLLWLEKERPRAAPNIFAGDPK